MLDKLNGISEGKLHLSINLRQLNVTSYFILSLNLTVTCINNALDRTQNGRSFAIYISVSNRTFV